MMTTRREWRYGFRLVLWGAAWLSVAVCSAPALETNVVINEFMALNDSTITNKLGKYADWIELYNTNSFSVSLKGWYLTDNPGKLNKWKFPTNAITTIASKGFLLVWADDKSYSVTNNELHASFSLSGDGEYLALVKPDGVTVVSSYAPTFPPQYADMSYGIGTNGEQRYFAEPTPGWGNTFSSPSNEVDGVTFSPKRGVYTNTVPAVTARCDTATAEIRYTTNAEPPTAGSVLYSTPFVFTHTAVIRAAGFRSGWAPSGIDTHSYVVVDDVLNQPTNPAGWPATWMVTTEKGTTTNVPGDYAMDPRIVSGAEAELRTALTSLPTLSLVTPMTNLFDPATGIYVNPWGTPADAWERAVSAEWITQDNASKFQIDCGLRIQGSWFKKFDMSRKKSFSLRFRSKYGEGTLREDLFSGNAVSVFNDLVLRAGGNDSWSSPGHERTQYIIDEFLRRRHLAMGGVSPHGRFVHLYLNGLYWGLYNVTEHVAGEFAASYFGGQDDMWDVMSPDGALNGTTNAWGFMRKLLSAAPVSNATYQLVQGNDPDGVRNSAYPSYLDVDNYIDYMILEYWSGNGDWPWNNWRAIRDRNDASSTGFKFVVWDAEFSIGLYTDNPTDQTGRSEGVAEMHQNLASNAEYRLRFADRVQKHLFNDGQLTPAVTVSAYGSLAAEVEPGIVAESARWGDQDGQAAHTLDQWATRRDDVLNTFLPTRGAVVLQQLKSRGLYPTVDAPVFSRFGGVFTNSLNLTVTAWPPIYYTLDGSDPRQYGTGAAVGTFYTTGVPLTRTARVKARARMGGVWSALTEAVFTLAEKPALRVTELMYHPRKAMGVETNGGYNADDFEFIELCNAGAAPIGLAGLHFTQGVAFDFTESAGPVLDPGAYLLVVKNIAAFTNRYPSVPPQRIAGAFAFPSTSLDNAGEKIEIEDAAGRTVVSFTYNNKWLPATDGAGHSLIPLAGVAQADGELDYSGNWKASVYIGGSPGQAEPVAPAASLVLNEILAHTDTNSLPYDSNDGIELYNMTAAPITLGTGWYLSDDPADLTKWAIPATNTLAAHGWRYFDEMHDFHNPITNGFGLNKADEQVLLSYLPGMGTGAVDRVVDAVSFKGEENGVPLIRYPDGATNWLYGIQTPGASNQLTAAGLVIAEIMYHPKPTAAHPENNENDEYVELYNPTAQAIGLTNVVNDVGGVWRLAGGIGYLFSSNTVLSAGGRLVVVSFDPATNAAARTNFLSAYGLTNGQIRILGPYSGQLNNKTDSVRLERPVNPDAAGEDVSWHVIDQVTYYDAAPWPAEADGTGRPLARRPGRNNGDDAASWLAGFWATPGMGPAKVAVTAPPANTGFLAPVSITVTAEVEMAFVIGTVSPVVFAVDGTNVASDSSAPYTASVALGAPEGVRRLTARLTDGEGAYTSLAVEIMVYTNVPAFTAGLNQTINLTVTDRVGLHAAAQIGDGMPHPVSFLWSYPGSGSVVFGNPTQAGTAASFTQAGTYELLLTMYYGQLATSRVVTVTVVDANTTNRVPYRETFEGYELGSTLVGIGGWTGAGAGAALIETNRYAAGSGGYPIAGAHERSLAFRDEGVRNQFEQTGALTNIYVDTLVACVPWTDAPPELPSDDQFAVAVTSNRHVAVWHGQIGNTNRWTELPDVTVDTNAFLRLTVQADYNRNPQGWFGFRLWINSEPVTQPTNWFATACTTRNFFGSAAFVGVGQVDDLVVSTDNPFAAYWSLNVTMSGLGGVVNPPVGVYAVKVGDNTNVVATVNDWYRIQSLTTNGAPIVAAAGQKSHNAPIASMSANGTNTVAVAFSGLASPLVVGVPNTWASNYYTEAQALADPNLATDWLLGIYPLSGTNYIPGLAITALAVTNGDLMIVMQLTTNGVPENTTINGTLQVLGSANLADGFTNIVSAELSRAVFSGNGEARTNFTGVVTPQHFYKARIVNPL